MRTPRPDGRRRSISGAALAAALVVPAAAACVPPGPGPGPGQSPACKLTVLHNNDGESQLLSAPGLPDFGGIARYGALLKQLQAEAVAAGTTATGAATDGAGGGTAEDVITLSSGDNFLVGPEFSASLAGGVPFYDAVGLAQLGYDAYALGNHEFDLGPDVLADFIKSFGPDTAPFLSANLDVSAEPSLAALEADGRLAPSTVVDACGSKIGVVGAVTPLLPTISSPRGVEVLTDLAGIVQDEVDALTADGVNKIVLISHLQDIQEELALVPMLNGVDVVIGGGGGELLANPEDALVPGDAVYVDPRTGQPLVYPAYSTAADGAQVPVVTTSGDYKYVGRLVVDFDRQGALLAVDDVASAPVRVSGVAPDAVEPDAAIVSQVVEPVRAYVDGLAENVVGQSEVALEGRRDPGIRTQETNLGNLLSDALLWSGQRASDEYSVAAPQVALQNGGGIRNNSLIPAGSITELDTFDIASFGNFVSVVPDVPRAQFKEILENAVSRIPAADGRFAQVAGFSFTYDAAGTAQQTADDGTIVAPGDRVQDVVLDDGTVIVQDGAVVDGPGISVATNDFSARGGDQYPFRGLPFTSIGLTYQQALAEYISSPEGLGATVTAADYPEGGSGRIERLG